MRSKLLKSIFSDDPELLAAMERRGTPAERILIKGDKGDMPVAGVDFPLPKDGEDYVLTPKDREDIAAQIDVPIVEKVIERHTETVRELPRITEVTKVVKETVKQELALTEDLVREFIKIMRKLPEKDRLEIQDIRNAQSFLKDGVRYKVEELMHGGGSSGSTGTVYLTPTGTVNAVNNIFGVTAQPSSVIADGITYFENAGYTYSALHVTLDVPPSQYIRYTP